MKIEKYVATLNAIGKLCLILRPWRLLLRGRAMRVG